MKKKFSSIVISLIMTMLMIFQPLMQSAAYAAEPAKNLGTVHVTVGDHTERDPKKLASEEPEDQIYKQPFGDIVDVVVPIAEGDTMYDSIRKALETKGIICNTTGKGNSVYIAGIGPITSQDGKRTVKKLSEFNGGRCSGWMGSLNDWYVNMGFGNWKVVDGDIINMQYTCQGLGTDLGQWWDQDDVPNTSLKSVDIIGGKLDKEFDSAVKEYTINVPYGTKSIQLNQIATNKAYNAQIFVGDKSYKRFRDIPVSKGTKIEIYSGKSLEKNLSVANTLYTLTVNMPELEHVSNEVLDTTVKDITKWYKNGNTYLMNSELLKGAGSTGGDWLPLGAARYGVEDNYQAYLDAVSKYVTEKYTDKNKLDRNKATEWERIALAVGAAGGDPTKIGKDKDGNPINLIADGTYNSIVNYERQGINAYVFGLITLDSRNYPVPEGSRYTRESIIKGVLSSQIASGGYQYGSKGGAKGKADPDMTAMAVQALAPYYKDSKTYTYKLGNKEVTKTVHQVVDEALESIRYAQKDKGDFASWGSTNVESTDQVIVALCALGIDPEKDSRFITSSGKTPVNGIMEYVMKDGGIAHTLETGSNPMATDQTLYTLAAIKRKRAGMKRLYDYTDIKYLVSQPEIINQPENKTISVGEEFTLSVSANTSDNGVLSYQWYKDDKEISGATSSTYKVSDVKESDGGNYYVIVTNTISNSKGTATSANVIVTVKGTQIEKPEQPSQFYVTDKDLKTGISTAEIDTNTIINTRDKVVSIIVAESPIRVNIPTSVLNLDSIKSMKLEHKEVAINSPIPNSEIALCKPFDLSLSTIDKQDKTTNISDFGGKLVTLFLNIDKEKISNYKLDTLKLYYYDGTTWIKVSDAKYDSSTGTISVNTPHFSTFVLTGESKNNTGLNPTPVINPTEITDTSEIKDIAKVAKQSEILPKTGNTVDTTALLVLGFGIMAIGLGIMLKRKCQIKASSKK